MSLLTLHYLHSSWSHWRYHVDITVAYHRLEFSRSKIFRPEKHYDGHPVKRVRRYSGDACVLRNLYLNDRQFSYLLQGGDIISGESYRAEDKSRVAFFQNFFQVPYDGAAVRP